MNDNLRVALENIRVDDIRTYVTFSADEVTNIPYPARKGAVLSRIICNLESHIASTEDNLSKVISELEAKGQEVDSHKGVVVRRKKLVGLKALHRYYCQELEDYHSACAYA